MSHSLEHETDEVSEKSDVMKSRLDAGENKFAKVNGFGHGLDPRLEHGSSVEEPPVAMQATDPLNCKSRRARWREFGVPDGCSQGTIAAGQCSQTLTVQRVQMMTEVPQIQFSDVRMQGREPTHQGDCVIQQSPQTVSQQPSTRRAEPSTRRSSRYESQR